MNIKIHPKIWHLIVKMYNSYYQDEFKDVLLSLQLKEDVSTITNNATDLLKFLRSLSFEDSLLVIKDILDNEDIKREKNKILTPLESMSKYFGVDNRRDWRPQLISYLRDYGIEYDDDSKAFRLVGEEPIPLTITKRKMPKLLDIEFNDFFYDSLKKEINVTYKFGWFTSTMFLSRKLIENLLIEILRIKYPPNQPENIELYFKDHRFVNFTILIKHLEERKDDFSIDTQIISEFISLVKPFRPRANANAHSLIITSNEEEVLKYDIQLMAALLFRLWNNLKLK